MTNEETVAWRLAHGSLCERCPLNGQRKVGVAGPEDADIILVGEAPGATEETWNAHRQRYGEPFVGKAGWALKVKLLGPAGLCDVDPPALGGGWPRVRALRAYIMNVAMCRPPKNKIDSPEGRKAVACCHRSAVALVQYLEAQKRRTYVPMGGTALALFSNGSAIGPYRGRVLKTDADSLHTIPESTILRIALRGIKPPEEWLPHQVVIKSLLTFNRRQLRRAQSAQSSTRLAKQSNLRLRAECKALAAPHLKMLSLLIAKQRARLNASKI